MAYLHRDAYSKALNTLYSNSFQRNAMDALLGGGSGLSQFGAPALATVTADQYLTGIVRQTKLTLSAVAQSVVNGTEYQSSKLYDFPEGAIQILGAYGSIAQTTTSTIATTLNSGVTGALALGTAAASATTLSSTMANVAPSIAFATSTVINVAGTAVTPFLAAPIILNGTGTAIDLYLNTAYATTGDVDADATQTLSGTLYITWINLGDL